MATPVTPVGDDGRAYSSANPMNVSTSQSYDLLNNASATGEAVGPVQGGDYLWRVEGTLGGSTVTLQFLGLDGVTWYDAVDSGGNPAAMTAIGQMGVGIAQGTVVRGEVVGGTPSALFSNIGGLG